MKKHLARAARKVLSAILILTLPLALNCSERESQTQQASRDELIVAAASDLASAFEELGKQFEQETGTKITFMFGSTGTLARQIENGAPADLFAAANIDFIDALEKQGKILPDTKELYARGRLTIWTRADSALSIGRIEDLARPEVQRVSIANPEHAPYGMAAREALKSTGIWDIVRPKLVLGENVRQALQYAQTGNVEATITALSLSAQSDGRWSLVPEQLHRPLDQALAVIKDARHEKQARRFAAFINSPQGRPVMRKYGFILPGEQPATRF